MPPTKKMTIVPILAMKSNGTTPKLGSATHEQCGPCVRNVKEITPRIHFERLVSYDVESQAWQSWQCLYLKEC